MVEHIVLAYSGGLDTSVSVHRLGTLHDADVTAVLVDIGQHDADLKQAEARALANGAESCRVLEERDAFADGFVAPAIQANALYEDAYPLATALARPLIAKALVDVAHDVGADAVAHGCTGKGNDQVRFELSVQALDPSIACLAPQRTHALNRDEALAYARVHDLELPPLSEGSLFSVDANLYGRSVEGGPLEDVTQPVPEEAYAWTAAPHEAPDEPATIEIGFEAGVPVALDGSPMPLAEICQALNQTAGEHGIGRIDHVENRTVGFKSREIHEAPAAVTILAAKQALEALTLTAEEQRFKPTVEDRFAQLVYEGQWYAPATDALTAYVETVQSHVTGTVELTAYKGSLTLGPRKAPGSLYDEGLATYGEEDGFDHEASTGFIEVTGLPLATAARTRGVGEAPSPAPNPEVP